MACPGEQGVSGPAAPQGCTGAPLQTALRKLKRCHAFVAILGAQAETRSCYHPRPASGTPTPYASSSTQPRSAAR
eukprot:1684253-Alexandrium_andersonii.AAC.1